MPRVASSLPDKSVYCHQTSFLLGRPWLLSVKVSAPLFLNNLNMNDRAWVQQKVSLIFLWFNIKVSRRKALGYAFKILTSDLKKKNWYVMFRFNHSLKEAGRKGCRTSTEKDYTTEHSIILGYLCHVPKGLSVGGLPWSAGSHCGYVWACGHAVWCVGRGRQSSRV